MDWLNSKYNEDTIFYDEEKYKFDIEIPILTQIDILSHIVALDPEKIIKEKDNTPGTHFYGSPRSIFSYRIHYYFFVKDGCNSANFVITIYNKKENIVYSLTLIIKYSGSNYGWEVLGYCQEKLHFFEELFQKYILSLNNPVLFI